MRIQGWIYESELQLYADNRNKSLEDFIKDSKMKYTIWEDCSFAKEDNKVYIWELEHE